MASLILTEEFSELLNYQGAPCISIFIPTHRSGVEVNEKQDAIFLKNALQRVTADLQDQGMPPQSIDALLRPGFELYKNEVFWNNQLDSLALFLADNLFKAFTLPYTVMRRYILIVRSS